MRAKASLLGTCVLSLPLLLSACGKGPASDAPKPGAGAEEAKSEVAQSKVERGPVRFTVEVAPKQPRLSDEPTLTLTFDCEKGVKVRKPPFGESLGDFLIRGFREPLPVFQGDREILQQVYTLEPTRVGEVRIHPIEVTFTDGRATGDGKEHTLESEALVVTVQSVAGKDAPSLADLKPRAGPVTLPRSGLPIAAWLGGAGLLALAGAGVGLTLWRRRRRAGANEKRLSPEEQAYLELERLLASRLVETDVKLFYVELTGIVRRYLEQKTGLRAPKETTEEFLRDLGRMESFPDADRGRLRAFLESADLVKFAAASPGKAEVEASFGRAKALVGLENPKSQIPNPRTTPEPENLGRSESEPRP
ncbi:MAG: hypothetical protein HYZ53_14495 [Planctomycetes bacterium]|nr:hypothetical protein [Planctomycetota bacterium]